MKTLLQPPHCVSAALAVLLALAVGACERSSERAVPDPADPPEPKIEVRSTRAG